MEIELETQDWEPRAQQCTRTVIAWEKVPDFGLETVDKHGHETLLFRL